jgi:hypothetical protein
VPRHCQPAVRLIQNRPHRLPFKSALTVDSLHEQAGLRNIVRMHAGKSLQNGCDGSILTAQGLLPGYTITIDRSGMHLECNRLSTSVIILWYTAAGATTCLNRRHFAFALTSMVFVGDILCLSHTDACQDAEGKAVTLHEGMWLTAFDEDADERGNRDDLLASGGVERSPEPLRCRGSRWILRIDKNGVTHESVLRWQGWCAVDHLNIERLLTEWRWLCPEEMRLVARNAFGDLFFRDHAGMVSRLDVAVGRLSKVADSESQFLELAKTREKREDWFAESDECASAARGLRPNGDQCIGFSVPLVFAEKRFPRHAVCGGHLRSCRLSRGHAPTDFRPARWGKGAF